MKNYFTNEKHYNTLSNYYKNLYGKKVYKIPFNINTTCPNRDGTLSRLGCLFCSSSGSGEFSGNSKESLQEQFEKGLKMMRQKWNDGYYIAYFQAHSNTYGSLEYFKKIYNIIPSLDKNFIKISIATRYDCISDDMLFYLEELNKKISIQIELGLQSVNNDKKINLNRFFDKDKFTNTVNKIKSHGLEIVVHIINGLPYETETDMLNTILYLNTLPINGIKIHMLNILNDAPLYKEYLKTNFHILTREEFINITVKQIRFLRKDIIIHRLTGDGKFENLIEPQWIKKKFVVINEIDKVMRNNNYYQGDNYTSM